MKCPTSNSPWFLSNSTLSTPFFPFRWSTLNSCMFLCLTKDIPYQASQCQPFLCWMSVSTSVSDSRTGARVLLHVPIRLAPQRGCRIPKDRTWTWVVERTEFIYLLGKVKGCRHLDYSSLLQGLCVCTVGLNRTTEEKIRSMCQCRPD